MRNTSVIGRVAAIAAVLLAIVAVAVIVLQNGSTYKVQAIFVNASQIVTGDQVEVAGNSIGSVSDISLTPNGLARLTLEIDNKTYQPLHEGTEATVRQTSLTGVANRYIDLRLGPANAPEINDGGTITTRNTTSAVDLDQLFNTLDAPTRKGLQDVIQGSASQYAGQGQAAQAAWKYLNPAVASSSMLFREINRDTASFTRFIVATSNLVTDLGQRSTDLSALVRNLSTTTQALASQRTALGQSIQQLPGFMRLTDVTFRNLRVTLDDLTPLVNASKPVAPKLQKLLVQLRPLAQEAVPTVRDLANIVSRPGADNDLIELTELGVPLAGATVRDVSANGKRRLGAFPQSTIALHNSTPELAVARPYAVDLTGWFEGFSHPGFSDANGNASRVAAQLGVSMPPLSTALSTANPLLNGINGVLPGQATGVLSQVSSTLASGGLVIHQGDRCPGSMERGAVFFPEPGFPCNPSEVPTGP